MFDFILLSVIMLDVIMLIGVAPATVSGTGIFVNSHAVNEP
jgi:hypothetical protein